MINIKIHSQPTDETCGPTCLQAVYDYYNFPIHLEETVQTVERSLSGGTLGPLLGKHALARGFNTILYTNNLNVFDPTWFKATYPEVGAREPVSYFIRQNTQGPVDPSPWFDTAAYLRARGDRRLTRLDPLSDYLAGGAWIYPPPQHEAAASAFAAAFPEVAAMGLTPLEHWAAGGS